jgi:hypothetical protein
MISPGIKTIPEAAMKVRIIRQSLLFAFLVLLSRAPLFPSTIHVPGDVATIQGAINVASPGDIVEVADGVWTGLGNRDLELDGRAITVRSANGPENCIIDCEGTLYSDEHRGFVCDDDEGRDTVIQGFTIIDAAAVSSGAAVACHGSSPTITGNIFTAGDNLTVLGIDGGSPLIVGNTFADNSTGPYFWGGCTAELVDNHISSTRESGVFCYESDVLIDGNLIEHNASVGNGGGGIECHNCSPTIVNNVIRNNFTDRGGAGISVYQGSPLIGNNLIEGNIAEWDGAGIEFSGTCSPVLLNNTITGNRCIGSSYEGGGICFSGSWGSTVIRNCIIWDNLPDSIADNDESMEITASYSDIEGGWPGTGNLDADPLFCVGPYGDWYLGQTAAGQSATSPCVDAGDPSGDAPVGTTRTDSAPDGGIVDMGFHYDYWTGAGYPPESWIVTGPGGEVDSPVLNFLVSGRDGNEPPSSLLFSHRMDAGAWSAYSAATLITIRGLDQGEHTFEVRARNALGYVDPTPAARTFSHVPWSDGLPWSNLVTGPGPGDINPTLVRTPHAEWEAYGVARFGVNVACGDLDGTGPDEVITGPGPGAVFGPHVRGWSAQGVPLAGVSFLAYGTHKYGVNVAAGDVDGDGRDEIITGAGPGAVFGPHVRGWHYQGGAVSPLPGMSYFAYGTLKWGVNVACGDLDGDGRDEIVTGAGPGAVFGPHVRGWRYQGGVTAAMPAVSFLAYGTNKYGVNVACGDLDDDGLDEIITGPGPSTVFGAHVRGWAYDGTIQPMPGVNFFAFDTDYGAVVGAGDVDNDGIDELLTAAGPDPALPVRIRAWNADGGSVSLVGAVDFQAYDDWMTHGGRVAGGNLN